MAGIPVNNGDLNEDVNQPGAEAVKPAQVQQPGHSQSVTFSTILYCFALTIAHVVCFSCYYLCY